MKWIKESGNVEYSTVIRYIPNFARKLPQPSDLHMRAFHQFEKN